MNEKEKQIDPKYSHYIVEYFGPGAITEKAIPNNKGYVCFATEEDIYSKVNWETDLLPKCPECIKFVKITEKLDDEREMIQFKKRMNEEEIKIRDEKQKWKYISDKLVKNGNFLRIAVEIDRVEIPRQIFIDKILKIIEKEKAHNISLAHKYLSTAYELQRIEEKIND